MRPGVLVGMHEALDQPTGAVIETQVDVRRRGQLIGEGRPVLKWIGRTGQTEGLPRQVWFPLRVGLAKGDQRDGGAIGREPPHPWTGPPDAFLPRCFQKVEVPVIDRHTHRRPGRFGMIDLGEVSLGRHLQQSPVALILDNQVFSS